MQKLAGSIPRQSRYARFAGFGAVATRFVPHGGKSATAKALARKSASGKAARARGSRAGCDCSSLPPLTLKPLRSPTPCPFAAVATAFYVRLRRTRGSAANGHGSGGCGSWLQRRQPSTMSAGWGVGVVRGSAPPPSRSLRGVLVRRSTAFERTRRKPTPNVRNTAQTAAGNQKVCLKVLQGVWRSISEQSILGWWACPPLAIPSARHPA